MPTLPLMIRALCLLALALALAGPAAAQLRPIPDEAKRGLIQHVADMTVSVDGKQMKLAPGATIRNQQNLIIVPVALPRDGAQAEFVLDASGQISRVWLLTREEAERPKKQDRPR